MPLADAVASDAPRLAPWLAWVWRAWVRLHQDRPQVATFERPLPRRIPWRDVMEWCRHHDHTDDEAAFMDRCFAAMDEAFLEWWKAQRPAEPSR